MKKRTHQKGHARMTRTHVRSARGSPHKPSRVCSARTALTPVERLTEARSSGRVRHPLSLTPARPGLTAMDGGSGGEPGERGRVRNVGRPATFADGCFVSEALTSEVSG